MTELSYKCRSCGTEHSGRFCPSCGEERLTPELRSASYLVRQLFTELTDLNGKFWLTCKTLITRPGQIDYDYSIGRRKIYVKPITLFLIINVVFVMFATLTDFFVNFSSQVNLQAYSDFIRPWLHVQVTYSGLTGNEFAEKYDQVVKVLARSLIIIQVPFFALLVSLICYQKKLFSGDYLTYSLNFHSWVLLIFLLAGYSDRVFYWINQTDVLPVQFTKVVTAVLLGGALYYLSLSMRRMFGYSWVNILWRLPLMIVAYYIGHFCYRFIQLLITVSLIDVPM